MKTLKITEEAWKKLSLFKTYNNTKTFSKAIETAIFYANTAHLPLGQYELKKQAIMKAIEKQIEIEKIWEAKENDKSKK